MKYSILYVLGEMTMMNVKVRAVNGPNSEFFVTEIKRR